MALKIKELRVKKMSLIVEDAQALFDFKTNLAIHLDCKAEDVTLTIEDTEK